MCLQKLMARAAISATLVLIALTACTSQRPIDRDALEQVRVISLAGFSDPKLSPMMEGALPSGDLNQILARENLHLGADLKSATSDALRQEGYKVLESNSGTSDAILNVTFGAVSYFSKPLIFGSGFGPLVMIEVHLENAKTGKTLMSHIYEYQLSTYTGLTGYVALAANEKYTFDAVEAMQKNPELAAEGLRASIPLFANSIARELSK